MMNVKEKLKFSIIVPIYNGELFLGECIDSILSQSYTEFELLLINDGSKDGSGVICDGYAQKDDRVRVFHKSNSGVFHSRVFGVDNASGDYCIFVDCDDTLENNALSVIHKKISQYDCDCLIYGFQRVCEGKVISDTRTKQEDRVLDDKKLLYKTIFMDDSYNSLCRKAVKISVFDKRDYADVFYVCRGEDLLHSIEILQNSKRVVIVDDVIYNYRMNMQSVTHTVTYENYKLDVTARQKVIEFLKCEAVFSEQDYIDYRSYCLRKILIEVFIISGLDTEYHNKVELFEQIKQTDYYQNFLMSGSYNKSLVGKTHFCLKLFKSNCYRTLIFVWKLYSLISKM